ncbi:MAG: MATE family efflux transporter [Christensenellaceae bacterium]|nr:MATE family efflux transporter [Christensenellaceae bacterium]
MKLFNTLTKQHDLTKGDPAKNILIFSIPLLIGNLAQQLYNTVDAIVVSHYIGDIALGAVGISGPAINLLIMIFVAISTGSSVLVGQFYGAEDRDNLNKTIGSIFILALIFGLIVTIISVLITEPVLYLLNTPEEMFTMATDYLRTIFWGITSLALYNLLTAALRALGDSFYPLLFLLVSTIVNIILDIIFVKYFHLGTFGVAIATVIAQSVSAILCIFRLKSLKDIFDMDRKYLIYNPKITKRIFKIGLPNAATQGIFSTAMIVIQSLTNSFGPLVITANTAVMRVDGFVMMPNFTFGIASTTFTAQNIGAKRLDRVREGAKATIKIGLITSTFLSLLIVIFGKEVTMIFSNTPEIIDYASKFMRILSLGYIAFTATQVFGGVMRGSGDTITPMWISIISVVLLRTPLAYLLVHLSKTAANPMGNPSMIFLGHVISWITGSILTVLAYKSGRWKRRLKDTLMIE